MGLCQECRPAQRLHCWLHLPGLLVQPSARQLAAVHPFPQQYCAAGACKVEAHPAEAASGKRILHGQQDQSVLGCGFCNQGVYLQDSACWLSCMSPCSWFCASVNTATPHVVTPTMIDSAWHEVFCDVVRLHGCQQQCFAHWADSDALSVHTFCHLLSHTHTCCLQLSGQACQGSTGCTLLPSASEGQFQICWCVDTVLQLVLGAVLAAVYRLFLHDNLCLCCNVRKSTVTQAALVMLHYEFY